MWIGFAIGAAVGTIIGTLSPIRWSYVKTMLVASAVSVTITATLLLAGIIS